LPPVEINFLAEMPKFDTYQINLFPYYWFDTYVDKHRVGIGFWSGEAIFNHLFARGHVFYGSATGQVGYKFVLSNRFPHLIGNTSDLKAEIKDDDGLKRITAKMETFFSQPKDYRKKTTLQLNLNHINLYSMKYNDPAVFEKTNYSSAELDIHHSEYFMLHRWDVALHAELGFSRDISYEKFFLSAFFQQDISKNSNISLRFFSAALQEDNYPIQERIFAAGDVDPKHEHFAISRQGSYAPLHSFSNGKGMNMPGYANSENPFFSGKAGSALSLNVKVKYFPVLYGSAGMVVNDLANYSSAPVLAEAGLKLNLQSMEFIFPLYINRPAANEKNWAFRFLFTLKTNFNLGLN